MADPDVFAVVSASRQRRHLLVGEVLTAGRAASADLRLGHEPLDLRVPRHALRLECRADAVLIYNTSDKRTLTAEVWPGPGFTIAPLRLAGTTPHPRVTLVIRGTAGARHAITIDATHLRPVALPPPVDDLDQRTTGYEPLQDLTERQRMVLCALVLPLRFGWHDHTGTPTYAQIREVLAERGVELSAKHVRSTLDEMRSRAALHHGAQGVQRESGPGEGVPPASYLPAFAEWVLISASVTDDELERFDALCP